VPTIDIDRDAAHEAAQHELGKPIYPKASLIERLMDWIEEMLNKLLVEGASVPGGWFTIGVLLILLAIAVVVAVGIARHTMRTNRGGDHALFGEHELSAAEHRATAEQFAAVGNWSAAIRHRLRAVARQLEESAVLDPVPAELRPNSPAMPGGLYRNSPRNRPGPQRLSMTSPTANNREPNPHTG